MCFNQTITMFLSEEVTALPKDKYWIDFKNTWDTVSVLKYNKKGYLIYTQTWLT